MKLDKIFTEKYFLSAGETNAEQEMALPLLVTKLIDIATAHANSLGIGNPFMPKPGCGWVLARLTIEMDHYPEVNSDYTISTWVESWNRHFSERAFRICDPDGNVYGYARSIWMVLDTETRANYGLANLNFDASMIADEPCPIERQEKHRTITDPHPVSYRFKYCDLDSYRHVNTVRYVDLLLNQFSLDTYDANCVGRLELSFLHEARYGMTAELHSEETAPGRRAFFLKATEEDTPILYSRLNLNPRTQPSKSL